MGSFIDLTGQKFGRLTVISRAAQAGRPYWHCHCSCGCVAIVRGSHLRGDTESCGCLRKERQGEAVTTHGASRRGPVHAAYLSWQQAKNRCLNRRDKSWKEWGGRGITVCERWQGFENFLADMGTKPPGMSLERLDNNGPYSPENCIWADWTTQARNRRNTPFIMVCGERHALTTACERYGIDAGWVRARKQHHKISLTEAFLDILDRRVHHAGTFRT